MRGGCCNTIDGQYSSIIPNKLKSMNVKVLYLKSGVNEAIVLVQNELCKWKCGLNEKYVIKTKWNHDEFQYEYKERWL